MIRKYAPIGLIPAAWALTFATVIYPGLDTYWIQHMHYFMALFLAGFTVLSWNEMRSDVLDIWRKVMAAGTVFTVFGALSFTLQSYSYLLASASLFYWFLAPGAALYLSSVHMESYSGLYRKLAALSFLSFLIFVSGLMLNSLHLQTAGIAVIALVQTVSIIVASKLDS